MEDGWLSRGGIITELEVTLSKVELELVALGTITESSTGEGLDMEDGWLSRGGIITGPDVKLLTTSSFFTTSG
jgi:hypothetical protein